MFEVNSAEDMERALAKMSEDQRDHLKLVITELVNCYINDDVHGLLMVGSNSEMPRKIKILSINATDMEAAALMETAKEFIDYSVMEDAPPKEKFN